jgi:hypothetical protein
MAPVYSAKGALRCAVQLRRPRLPKLSENRHPFGMPGKLPGAGRAAARPPVPAIPGKGPGRGGEILHFLKPTIAGAPDRLSVLPGAIADAPFQSARKWNCPGCAEVGPVGTGTPRPAGELFLGRIGAVLDTLGLRLHGNDALHLLVKGAFSGG